MSCVVLHSYYNYVSVNENYLHITRCSNKLFTTGKPFLATWGTKMLAALLWQVINRLRFQSAHKNFKTLFPHITDVKDGSQLHLIKTMIGIHNYLWLKTSLLTIKKSKICDSRILPLEQGFKDMKNRLCLHRFPILCHILSQLCANILYLSWYHCDYTQHVICLLKAFKAFLYHYVVLHNLCSIFCSTESPPSASVSQL